VCATGVGGYVHGSQAYCELSGDHKELDRLCGQSWQMDAQTEKDGFTVDEVMAAYEATC
jgi:hypothetical protein